MSIMKRIIKWIINFGIKCITKLVRTASEMSGTPKSKLPTEKDIIWELGATAAKAVAKSKCKSWWARVIEPVQNFIDRCRGITPLLDKDRVSYSDDPGLVIDV